MKRIIIIGALLSGSMMNVTAMQLSQEEQAQDTKLKEILRNIKEGRSYYYNYSDLATIAKKIKTEVLRKVAAVTEQQLEASDDALDEVLGLLWIIEKGEAIQYGEYLRTKEPLEAIKAQKEARRKALAGPTAEELAAQRRIEEGRVADEKLMLQQKEQIIQASKERQLPGFLSSLGNFRLKALASRFKETTLAKAHQASTDSSLDDLDESIALLGLLMRGDEDNRTKYLILESSLSSIRHKKTELLKAAAGPTSEEKERARIAQEERLAREAQQLEKYNALKTRIIETRKQGPKEQGVVANMVGDALRQGITLELGVLWEFLDWLKPEAFSRGQAIIDSPEAATIEEIDMAQGLLAAFYRSARPDSHEATVMYSDLDQLKSNKVKALRLAAEEAFRQSPDEIARRQQAMEESRRAEEQRVAALEEEFMEAFKINRSYEQLEHYGFAQRADRAKLIKAKVLGKVEAIRARPDDASIDDIDYVLSLLPLLIRGDDADAGKYRMLDIDFRALKAQKEKRG